MAHQLLQLNQLGVAPAPPQNIDQAVCDAARQAIRDNQDPLNNNNALTLQRLIELSSTITDWMAHQVQLNQYNQQTQENVLITRSNTILNDLNTANGNLVQAQAGLLQAQQTIQGLQNVAGNAGGAAAPLAQIKVPQPKAYGGLRTEARPFIQALKLYFETHPGHFNNNDHNKIQFAVSLLTDKALIWADPMQRGLLMPQGQRPAICTTWATFEQAFNATFMDPDEALTARRQMRDLKQTTSAADYTIEWRRIASLLGWGDGAPERAAYFNGLKPRVQSEIVMREEPATLEELISLAQRVDSAQYTAYVSDPTRLRAASAPKAITNRNNPPPPPAPTTYTKPPTFTTTSTTMQTGTSTTPIKQEVQKVYSKLTEPEKEKLRQEQKCFYCRQPGHMAQQCPNKRVIRNIETINEEFITNPLPVIANPYGEPTHYSANF